MPTQSSKDGSKAKTQAKRATTEAKKSAAASTEAGKRAVAKSAAAQKSQVQTVAETAVDFPVGVVLSVGDRVGELVEPWTDRGSAEKQLKSYRNQLRKTIKRTERRGASARRKATTEARKTRNRVEREARRRQRTVESTLKSSRSTAERRVRAAIDEPTTRARDLVSTVTDQFSALR
jgi:hypothetical protein